MYESLNVKLVVENNNDEKKLDAKQKAIKKRNMAKIRKIQKNMEKGKKEEAKYEERKSKPAKSQQRKMLELYIEAKRELDREIERKDYNRSTARKTYFDYLLKHKDNEKVKLTEKRRELLLKSIEQNEDLRKTEYIKYLLSKTYGKNGIKGVEKIVSELQENINDPKYQKSLTEYLEEVRKIEENLKEKNDINQNKKDDKKIEETSNENNENEKEER